MKYQVPGTQPGIIQGSIPDIPGTRTYAGPSSVSGTIAIGASCQVCTSCSCTRYQPGDWGVREIVFSATFYVVVVRWYSRLLPKGPRSYLSRPYHMYASIVFAFFPNVCYDDTSYLVPGMVPGYIQ